MSQAFSCFFDVVVCSVFLKAEFWMLMQVYVVFQTVFNDWLADGHRHFILSNEIKIYS